MTERILLCTDLDRTLLPNGDAPESAQARTLFARLASHPNCTLAYVSGRYKALVQEAIAEFNLPVPNFVIGDVGTSIYQVDAKDWQEWPQWAAEIAADWGGREQPDLQPLFSHLSALTLQESSKQNRFKLSYYLSATADPEPLLSAMRECLTQESIRAELIYSVDESTATGLLDVLPASATKYHAVEFLMQQLGFGLDNTVFAGDSGNDLPVLTSPINSVLVANATDEVRRQALQLAREQATEAALYLAAGGFMGMNGNYGAGILEGVAHYLPQTKQWMNSDD
ncbi:MAG: HAD-IIB family hydrolase [Methylobacter sp.]|nr:HAD-IIB family hydrolase [Methylobacter sp.]MDP2097242.1 HAD-IIB family hydrolase [Methylobacter sp.]MDP2427590.1 HAD-IIB family hydrolase [Methylobacter sp.]MDP3054231.1 HAD-IIB family hydrolase [Methylobacter sp.]MDP3364062.1 HAD-IIB family hydrolase [Methylobacter sp.]